MAEKGRVSLLCFRMTNHMGSSGSFSTPSLQAADSFLFVCLFGLAESPQSLAELGIIKSNGGGGWDDSGPVPHFSSGPAE